MKQVTPVDIRNSVFTRFWLSLTVACLLTVPANAQLKNLKASFINPKDAYKPGVYWYFMDGNMSAETITKDLESMKKAGIGNLIFLEVNVDIPRGPVDFLSDQWSSLFLFAEKEAKRLGIEITLGIGPGWTGSGGPWVKPAQSMQHLVSSTTTVTGGSSKKIVLPVPLPKRPFFGEGSLTPEIKKEWNSYYQDVAVLAFPITEKISTIDDYENKALYYRAPYSSGTVKPYLPSPATESTSKTKSPSTNNPINKSKIIDLTGKMQADGTLNWSPPAGKWTIMRFASRNNGAITRPAPVPGLGFEADKFDTTALNSHLDAYLGKILKGIGKIDNKTAGGLKRLHMDSWEMGAQNWTAAFRKEFLKRRKYDPLKYYPVYNGQVVGSLAESERFLWDLRQTSQELVLENHAQHVKDYAKRHHLSLSIEPYDMNPTADLELGSIADVPMAEFWSKGFGFNSTYSVIEATSIAHIMGKSLVPAEAFTAQDEGWKQYPGSMKNQGDWAFAAGINRFVYHTFQNQFLADSLKPGATMGPYGVHWDRSQTWWPMVSSYHQYITRCQYLLQQGRTVADILYLTPEGAPHVFVPPVSAIEGDTIGNRKGYNFDGCSAMQLMKASVKDHKILFPGGASYPLLVLPYVKSMTPKLLAKIKDLVQQGATVVGSPPLTSPSLTDFPNGDNTVKLISKRLWGSTDQPIKETQRKYGKGLLVWGGAFDQETDHLYPAYHLTAKLLRAKNITEDFRADSAVRYTHRSTENEEIYFLANTTNKSIKVNGYFRTVKGSPELWNAVTGKISPVVQFTADKRTTTIPLQLAAYESCFIVFSKENKWPAAQIKTETSINTLATLYGSWEVNFDPKWGGPAHSTFDILSDWSKNKEEGIKYYSGIAAYHKTFDISPDILADKKTPIYLDLGKVSNLARITLNGKDLGVVWTAPWRVDISSALQEKNNELKIEVANLWPNRLIGDEKKPFDGVSNGKWPDWLLNNQPRKSGRYTFTSTTQYNADSPLIESGLLDPVKLVKEVKIRTGLN